MHQTEQLTRRQRTRKQRSRKQRSRKQRSRKQRSRKQLSGEQGTILPIVALCLVLIVAFGIGYAIDLPTVQSAAIRAQHALDIGTAHAVHSFQGYEYSAEASYLFSGSVMSNTYGQGGQGNFSNGVSGNETFRAWIPRLNIDPEPAPGRLFSFNNLTADAEQLQALSRVFDVAPIDDFKNAIAVFSRFRPYQHFPLIPTTDIDVMSLAMLRPALTYVLIDPAFSLDEENFYFLVGQSESSTENLWPLAGVAIEHAGDIPNGGWSYPEATGLLSSDPLGGRPFSSGTIPGSGTDPTLGRRIYQFYASLCDSMPFYNYKAAATDVLDWLTGSSAFNSTTMVGLTGYNSTYPIVPVHPIAVQNNIAVHPSAPSEFPLTLSPVDSNRGLHHKKRTAFDGFVNSLNPSVTGNIQPGADGQFETADDTAVGTGLNRWELCFCRGLYIESTTRHTPFQLSEDSSYVPGDEAELHHELLEERRRRFDAVNWCDDERVNIGPATSPRDEAINLGLSQNGQNGVADGETPRNLVSGLGIRTTDLRLDTILTPEGSAWTRPTAPPPSGSALPLPLPPMSTGYRYLPTSLAAAIEALRQARDDYSADPNFGRRRPLGKTAVMSLAFGVWSESTARLLANERGLSPETSEQHSIRDLREVLATALCDQHISVIFNFLPMNQYDRNTVVLAKNVIEEYERVYVAQQQGRELDALSIPNLYAQGLENRCNEISNPIAPIYFFFTDYVTMEAENPRLAKLSAATSFRSILVHNMSQILVEHVFPM